MEASVIKLIDLVAGDKVVINARSLRIETIDRVTKTQIIVGSTKFRREGGGLIGDRDRFNPVSLQVLTPKLEEKIKAQNLKQKKSNLLYEISRAAQKASVVDKMSVEDLVDFLGKLEAK